MRFARTDRFKKSYKRLPVSVQKQIDKQLVNLSRDFRHPSLKARKMSGQNVYEARVSKGYRFRYQVNRDLIILLTVGPHDVGLGIK